jgi:hypothetical protein
MTTALHGMFGENPGKISNQERDSNRNHGDCHYFPIGSASRITQEKQVTKLINRQMDQVQTVGNTPKFT